MRLLGILACIGVAACVVVGCDVYNEELIETSTAGVPPRPPAETSSEADGETLVFALKDVFVEQSAENAGRIGIDLDGTVTTSQETASCRPREINGEVVGQSVVDGDKGIDNSLGTTLLPAASAVLPCLQDNLALTMGRGVGTILVVIRDWNGEDDDASVTATLTTSVAGTSEDPSLVGFGPGSDVDLVYMDGNQDQSAPNPGWAGHDSWFVDPVDFETGPNAAPDLERPRVVHPEAYVAFRRLVVPLVSNSGFILIAGDGSIPSDGTMSVFVNGGFMMGDISQDRSRLDHGLFTGRMTLETLGAATSNIGICAFNATVIETLFGEYADVPSDPTIDGLDTECDAFSLGVTFTGVSGQLAGAAPSSRPLPHPCAGTTDAPSIDRCCPSEWAAGRTRQETCDSTPKGIKAAAFDALPETIQLPVLEPDYL